MCNSNIIFIICIAVVIYFAYVLTFKHSYIEGMSGKNDCLDGCVKPTNNNKCGEKVFKDKGGCYKKCPYECSDSYQDCQYKKDCMGCGFKKLKVNCDGTMTPDVGKKDGKKDGNPKPDGKPDDKPDGKLDGKPDGKLDGKLDGMGLFKNLEGGMSDNMKHLSAGIQSLFKNKFETTRNVHVHHHVKHSSNTTAPHGGILSDQYKNLPRRERKKGASDIYNWGAPGTPLDLANEVKNFNVDYTNRPTTTGMFTNTGPDGYNIGDYKPYSRGCDFPVNN